MKHTFGTLVPLKDLAIIQATGADAVSFLHGQLTQDIQGLDPAHAALAGYCTAKGRLLASMVIWKQNNEDQTQPVLRAIVKADLAQALVKRLSMFVLRAKVQIQVTSLPVYGVMHDKVTDGSETPDQLALNEALSAVLVRKPQPWSISSADAWCAIAAPSVQENLARWWLVPVSSEPIDTPALTSADPVNDSAHAQARWQTADIAAGIPWVQAATQDVFIPQTLNFDLIGGVSFTKGCYPGQEVVARAHYRGTVKRRMAYGLIDGAPQVDAASLPGTDTYNAHQPENPCGRIVDAATQGDTLHLLMEVQLSDLAQAEFRLGSADGPLIQAGNLPYPLDSSGQP